MFLEPCFRIHFLHLRFALKFILLGPKLQYQGGKAGNSLYQIYDGSRKMSGRETLFVIWYTPMIFGFEVRLYR